MSTFNKGLVRIENKLYWRSASGIAVMNLSEFEESWQPNRLNLGNGGSEMGKLKNAAKGVWTTQELRWHVESALGPSWIPHNGGECPIPWAAEDDFVIKLRCGKEWPASRLVGNINWGRVGDENAHTLEVENEIVAYRLTDRWIPVIRGKCPQALGWKMREWEWKDKDGTIEIGGVDIEEDSWCHAVAVRLIEKSSCFDCGSSNSKSYFIKRGMRICKECFDKSAFTWLENDGVITIAAHQDIAATETEKQRLTREASIEQERAYGQQFTAGEVSKRNWINAATTEDSRAKRQLTADACSRYFAKLHAKSEPYRCLTDDAINDIAAAALIEHDKVWPRKA